MAQPIQVSEDAVRERAMQLGMATAREQLQVEAARAQEAREQETIAARTHYSETLARAKAQLAELEKDYAARGALASELGPKAVEIIHRTNDLQRRIDAIYTPALQARAHMTYLNEPGFMREVTGDQDVVRALGGTALETHLRSRINITNDTEHWAAFLLALLTRGSLAISTIDGKRVGVIQSGGQSIVVYL